MLLPARTGWRRMPRRAPCGIASNDSCAARFDLWPRKLRPHTGNFPWSSRKSSRSRFATDDDADFAGVFDLDDGALVVEVRLCDAAEHFDLASARILDSWNEYFRRLRGGLSFSLECNSWI